jgi:hypothetical protein
MTTTRVQQYAAEAAQRHGVAADAVLGRDKHAAPCAARRDVMCRLRADGFTTSQIGRWMQRDRSTVSEMTRKHR